MLAAASPSIWKRRVRLTPCNQLMLFLNDEHLPETESLLPGDRKSLTSYVLYNKSAKSVLQCGFNELQRNKGKTQSTVLKSVALNKCLNLIA